MSANQFNECNFYISSSEQYYCELLSCFMSVSHFIANNRAVQVHLKVELSSVQVPKSGRN